MRFVAQVRRLHEYVADALHRFASGLLIQRMNRIQAATHATAPKASRASADGDSILPQRDSPAFSDHDQMAPIKVRDTTVLPNQPSGFWGFFGLLALHRCRQSTNAIRPEKKATTPVKPMMMD